MKNYILQRLLLGIPVIVGVSLIVFSLVQLLPGDIAAMTLGQGATEERLEALREELGLNRSIPAQYADWAGSAVTGDLGNSLRTKQPVTSAIGDRLPVTFELAVLSTLIGIFLAVPLAIISAVKQDSIIDYVVRFISILGLSIPGFWLGLMMILVPSLLWQWSVPVGYRTIFEDPLTNIQQVGMPAIALGVALSAFLMRILRSSLLEVLRQDYMRTAKAKGLKGRIVIIRHGLKNAFIPVLTVIGLQFSALLGGTVILEQIFSLPGLGRLTYDAILSRDYPLIQGTVMFFSVVFVLTNLIVDVLYAQLDPRVRLG